jgi:hypothetical protein
MDNKKIIIVTRESIIESVIKDIFSMIFLGALFYFNQHFIGGSYFVNFLIIVMILIYVIKYTNSSKVQSYTGASNATLDKVIAILEEEANNNLNK